MKKIFFYNLIIFIIFVVLSELMFGYWFDDDNFGIHMRKHRNRNDLVKTRINNVDYKYYYKRNFYGFRGKEINKLKDINYVFLGGSTGNEKFLPENLTIVGLLNKFFSYKKKSVNIVNASVDGKTSRGHINDLQIWFPKLKKFNPDYFIIYVGINDTVLNQDEKYDLTYDDNIFKNLRDVITNNSIIVELSKKIKWKYFEIIKFEYDVNQHKNLYKNFLYVNYNSAKKIHDLKKLKIKHKNIYERYKLRLNNLYKEIKKSNSKIIFITQVKFNGLKDEKLFLLNETLKKFSFENKINILKLDEIFVGSQDDFYDEMHTTPQGSEKIAKIMFEYLFTILKKN